MEESQTSSAGLESLLGLGKPWTRVGYGVLVVAVAAFVVNLTFHPLVPTEPVVPLKANAPVPAGATIVETSLGRVALPPGFRAEVRGKTIQALPDGYRLIGGEAGGAAIRPTTAGVFGVFLLIFSALTTFVWTLVDIVDRRKRFVWMLPLFICPFLGVLHALPLALYIFFGRETASSETGVH